MPIYVNLKCKKKSFNKYVLYHQRTFRINLCFDGNLTVPEPTLVSHSWDIIYLLFCICFKNAEQIVALLPKKLNRLQLSKAGTYLSWLASVIFKCLFPFFIILTLWWFPQHCCWKNKREGRVYGHTGSDLITMLMFLSDNCLIVIAMSCLIPEKQALYTSLIFPYCP